MMTEAKVLIVSVGPELPALLAEPFSDAGLAIVHTDNIEVIGLAAVCASHDVVILDRQVLDSDTFGICHALRANKSDRYIPVAIVSIPGPESDVILALECGADLFLVKPFSALELVLRVWAVLRRSCKVEDANVLRVRDVECYIAARKVMRRGRVIYLGPTNFRLLEFLMRNSGRVMSRRAIIDGVWGRGRGISGRTVDVHIALIRRALVQGKEKDLIRTVLGEGYVFDRDPPKNANSHDGAHST